MKFAFLSLSFLAAIFLAACQTPVKRQKDWDVPLTLQTVGPAYATYALETADANKDGNITMVEWTNAGGTKQSFLFVDENKDGIVTRGELMRFGSRVQFFDTTRRYLDFNKDNQLTPREFRTPAGVRVLRAEF